MQSRTVSLIEAIAGTCIGFGVATLANLLVLPLFGFPVNLQQSAAIAAVFTVISVARGYLVRRFFEWLERGGLR